ncbi:hypothetical protein [Leptospira noguchii]|uniref:Uncharacterized protein n=1 Tax=Leptospira noguchii TaxID=28182 RepID=A0A9Q8RML1_9LEPT|nr:hypothetical protein [Leptospira noguchii]TQE72764.1 hypothetical protein FF021_13445 [Leptospira noguchii]UOG31088.1 hypothetical protein MAL06_03215 [Leptospira noguchii]UOG53239.1 hypothetical protein MAL09_03340 [Leptospira noguchii]UOG57201.1 hypothetical protein MAL03_03175 [Leptospira noguchii]
MVAVPWFDQDYQFYVSEIKSVKEHFPDLHFKITDDNLLQLIGSLNFRATFPGYKRTIEDTYFIKIKYPNNYPSKAPVAIETAGKIPRSYHTNPDKTLCLGTNHAVDAIFKENPCTIHFIEKILIPYLFRYSALYLYKEELFGELKHGAEGLIDYYKSLFVTQDQYSAINLLKYIKDKPYRGHLICPCGSGKKIRNCHGDKLIQIYPNKLSVLRDLDIIFGPDKLKSKKKKKRFF